MTESIVPILPSTPSAPPVTAGIESTPKVKREKKMAKSAPAEDNTMLWYGLGGLAILLYFMKKGDSGGSELVRGGSSRPVSVSRMESPNLYRNPVPSDSRVEPETVTRACSGGPQNGWSV